MNNIKKIWVLISGILIGFLIVASEVKAQDDSGFIYGKVYTISGDTFQGQIRWGKEETYWSDLFNGAKTRNNSLKYLSLEDQKKLNRREKDGWLGLDWKFLSIWEDRYSSSSHQFNIQFGEIKEITTTRSSRVEVKLKNGVVFEVSGEGYNDIGATLYIKDQEIGEVELKWSRVDKVEFVPTPKRLESKFGNPIYGTVKTRKGDFTGLIWWDHDESLSTDKLDGDTRDGDLSIEFGNIKQIIKEGRGSRVVLNSGREFYLTGSNDVDEDNRGIEVGIENLGKVDIEWEDFREVTFDHSGKSGAAYDSYTTPTGIKGTVKVIDDRNLYGLIIFDLDEAWEFEMLEGKDDDIEYKIPFRFIKSITPKNYNYSTVLLKNGTSILLGDARDVSEDNDGLLVFVSDSEDPVYIPWKKVDEIILD